MDELHGEGGTFEIDKATGKRRRVGEPFGSHKEGDRARDASGKPIVEKRVEPQPALPAPARSPYEPQDPESARPAKGSKA